jgi:hypothetical protein
VPDGAASSRPLFDTQNLKAQEIEMELTNVHDDEAFQISALKKCQTPFLQERTELGDDLGGEGLPILIWHR